VRIDRLQRIVNGQFLMDAEWDWFEIPAGGGVNELVQVLGRPGGTNRLAKSEVIQLFPPPDGPMFLSGVARSKLRPAPAIAHDFPGISGAIPSGG